MSPFNHFLLSALVIPTVQASAQTAQDTSLVAAVERYIDFTEAGDMRGCMDMIHPVLFKMADKETLIQALEEQQEGQEGRTRIEDGRMTGAIGPFTEDGRRFALVTYAFTLYMTLPPDSSEAGEPLSSEEQAEADAFVVSMMEEMYGKEKVTWTSSSRQLVIKLEQSMYAIDDPTIGAWRFLEKKEGRNELVAEVIPNRVLKKLDR